MSIAFLDTEFTDFLHPGLLTLGLVTLDGREHCVELDMSSEMGRARGLSASSNFLRFNGVLDQWGCVPSAQCTEWEMGRRTGEWLLEVAQSSGLRVSVASDYLTDYELMEHAIRDAGLWERVREVVQPLDIDRITGAIEGELAADERFREMQRTRGLSRHHALADALALRAVYLAVRSEVLRLTARGGLL